MIIWETRTRIAASEDKRPYDEKAAQDYLKLGLFLAGKISD
jgi:hypothetical protein